MVQQKNDSIHNTGNRLEIASEFQTLVRIKKIFHKILGKFTREKRINFSTLFDQNSKHVSFYEFFKT